MISQIKYIASSGNEYDLTTNGVLHKSANYYSWAWEVRGTVLQYGIRVADFSRPPAEYDTELVIYGTPTERRRILTELHDDFENDLRKKKPGRIIWGDYYIDCYVIQSQSQPMETWAYISDTIHIYAPHPFWIKEEKVSLYPSTTVESEFLDYPHDFPFDYTQPPIGTVVVGSDFPFESEFKMIIYGAAVNPRITINGYDYVLYTTIPANAYAVIDSRTHSITLFNNDGTHSNLFDFRNKTDSVFQKIPGDNLQISWDATFGTDIIIYRERSEPEFGEVTG